MPEPYNVTLVKRRCAKLARVKRNYLPELKVALQDLAPLVNEDTPKDFVATQTYNACVHNGMTFVEDETFVHKTIDEGLPEHKPKQTNGNGHVEKEPKPILLRPAIQIVSGQIAHTTTLAERALIDANVEFYVRAARLMRPIREKMEAADGRTTITAHLVDVLPEYLADRLSRSADFQKYDGRKKAFSSVNPPHEVCRMLLARHGEFNFPALAGIITCPTLRPDGSILSAPGYDSKTRLLLVDPPALPGIKEKPTRDDAFEALEVLLALLAEFPFSQAADQSVALSALMTPVLRGIIRAAPFHCLTAPQAGSGKSFLVDIVATIATGNLCPVVAASTSEEEMEKRLVGMLLRGSPIISLDNLSVDPGGNLLSQAIDREIVVLRPLGASDEIEISNRASLYATGNNITPTGDMVRRTLRAVLDANMERPELREFKANPIQMILSDRGKYIAAILTIVRAYRQAGRH